MIHETRCCQDEIDQLENINAALGTIADPDTADTHTGLLKYIKSVLVGVWSNAANALGVILRRSDGTEIGTVATPIRVDTTGTTTQPISDGGGSITIDGAVSLLSSANNIGYVDVLTLPVLPQLPALLGQQTRLLSLSVTQASDAVGVNAQQIQGTSADGSAVAGNPVLSGGVDGVGNTQTIAMQTTGAQRMTLETLSGSPIAGLALNADGIANPFSLSAAASLQMFNGTTWDRVRNNHEVIPLTLAARTVATNSIDQVNYNSKGVIITIDVTAISGVGALTVNVVGKSTLANAYRTILTSAAIIAIGRTVLKIYPGLAPVANLTVSDALERIWRVEVGVASVDSMTYSVSANYVT